MYTVNFHPDGSLAASGGTDAIGEQAGCHVHLHCGMHCHVSKMKRLSLNF